MMVIAGTLRVVVTLHATSTLNLVRGAIPCLTKTCTYVLKPSSSGSHTSVISEDSIVVS